ncbi:hypothetical protein BGP78_16935 [Pseudoalteromonas sp. MSK9-3]|uniref:TonB-dependent receptor plug domain-containing protein n=1 Tax=Pseudoalteromonas sp. MSK9-3 TaxID=1897633 RepID=UPI000E6D1F11|nr:TonB-dependent receptor [Pseudoalteromonas sp. MSK9-3]RJE73662.1 hypothetical protein BGP78_16935 [Pseudoalteromonas sp. MSK9-3]
MLKKLNLLAVGIKAALLTGAVSGSAAMANDTDEAKKVERIQVTGSRIKRTDMEGPAPVLSITAADLKDKGFNNAYDAVQSLSSATGSTQGQTMSGFTQNAETVNFRGLGANRSLVLLNGKRVANYPRAFNGESNVFNLASIPFAAIERIDIVTGGSSAIYGSDAIAGVMNIITKSGVEDNTLNIKGSSSDQGDAYNRQISFVTGGQHDDFSWTLALDHSNQDMLFENQRDWLDSRFDNPAKLEDYKEYAIAMPRSLMAMQYSDGWQYIDPTAEVCNQFDNLQYANRESRGYYCSNPVSGNNSVINDRKNSSIYATGTYELNSDHQVRTDILYWTSKSSSVGSAFWDSRFLRDEITQSNGYFQTEDGQYHYLTRTWQDDELGNKKASLYDESMLTASLSFTGAIFEDYYYESYVSYSRTDDTQTGYKAKKETASDYFVNYDESTGAASINWDNWWQPLNSDNFDQVFGLNDSESSASVLTLGSNVTGDLYELPAGFIAFSALVEYEKSEYDINVNPRTLKKEGQGWAGLTGTEGEGERSRSALALEFSIPVTEQLTVDLAARYDRYNDETDVNGAPTYQVGVAYRPTEEVLLRANWGTTFRAPDLHNVFKDPSGSYSTVEDEALAASCRAINANNPGGVLIPNADIASLTKTCTDDFNMQYTAFSIQSGEKRLTEETGESLTLGLVWQPTDSFNMTFDLYRILMEDAVRSYPNRRIMEAERDCLNGAKDGNSEFCQSIYARIDRNPANGLSSSYKVDSISSSFINAAMREQTGFDLSISYEYDLNKYGSVAFRSDYSHVLQTKNQEFTGDEVNVDYREDYKDNNEFRSKMTNRITYSIDDWRVTLEQQRYGSLPNDVDEDDWTQVEKRRYAPWFNYNLGVNYFINDDSNIRFGVINLRNSRARYDESENDSPYFDNGAYPGSTIIIGRQFTLEYNLQF